MSYFSIDVEGLREAIAESNRMSDNIEDDVQNWLKAICERIVAEIRSEIQNHQAVWTGELHATTRILKEEKHEVELGSDSEHASYWEEGRGPIRPINALVLHFFTKDGKEVFTKYVPPMEGTHIFEVTITRLADKLAEELDGKLGFKIQNIYL